jgi:uncharacterized protein YjdB
LEPEGASGVVTWQSDHPEFATVTNGLVTAKSAGTATITASCAGKTATCQVTVSSPNISVSSVSLNKESTTLAIDGTETLTAEIQPPNATNKQVTWESSDPEKVTVVEGLITGKAITIAPVTITVKTVDGNKTDTCEVEVTE